MAALVVDRTRQGVVMWALLERPLEIDVFSGGA